MSNNEAEAHGRTTKWDDSLPDPPSLPRALGWTFLKSVAFSAFICVIVLGMAELVTR